MRVRLPPRGPGRDSPLRASPLGGLPGEGERSPCAHRCFAVRGLLAAALAAIALGTPLATEAWEHLPPGTRGWTEAGRPAIRGITVGPIESSQQPGRGYGTAYSAQLLDHLATMGVNWISLTPFGRLWSLDDTTILMDFEAPYADNRLALAVMVRQAHARGMRVLVIPHLWIETGGWRGEIELGSRERWEAYQASYGDFITRWAADAAAAGADAFSIGVECKSWSGRFGAVWRALISQVRRAFPGLLTYSANWDEVEDVLFWDQLDLIGINAFYPLADHPGATYREYVEGATRNAEAVRETAEVLEMPVVFVEVGYTSRADAAVQPWVWPDGLQDVRVDEDEQARALAATFRAFLPLDAFAGFFVWRYYANLDDVSQEAIWGFSPHAKVAEPMLARVLGTRWAADPEPWPWVARDGGPGGSHPFAGLFPVPGPRP